MKVSGKPTTDTETVKTLLEKPQQVDNIRGLTVDPKGTPSAQHCNFFYLTEAVIENALVPISMNTQPYYVRGEQGAEGGTRDGRKLIQLREFSPWVRHPLTWTSLSLGHYENHLI